MPLKLFFSPRLKVRRGTILCLRSGRYSAAESSACRYDLPGFPLADSKRWEREKGGEVVNKDPLSLSVFQFSIFLIAVDRRKGGEEEGSGGGSARAREPNCVCLCAFQQQYKGGSTSNLEWWARRGEREWTLYTHTFSVVNCTCTRTDPIYRAQCIPYIYIIHMQCSHRL